MHLNSHIAHRDKLPTDYRDTRVTVMGLGEFGGGIGAVRFLATRGARVTISDVRTESELAASIQQLANLPHLNWKLGAHNVADFTTADFIVVNPAVKPDHPLLQHVTELGIPLTSEMNLFFRHNPAPIIAVTGSNGKSTTTALIHHLISSSGLHSWLGGNIGGSLLPRIEEISPDHRVVLELSSFQLMHLDRIHASPQISVVTNFTPNHLDWHGTLDNYRHAKQTILRWQSPSDWAVLNADDSDVREWPTCGQVAAFGTTPLPQLPSHLKPRMYTHLDPRTGTVQLVAPDSVALHRHINLRDNLPIPGRHNQLNAAAAIAAIAAAGIPLNHPETSLSTYQPLPHRLELVATTAGRRFFNDSLATTPESALCAIDAFDAPIILLCGGYDKGSSLTEFAANIARRTKAASLMGQTAPHLSQFLQRDPQRTCRFQECTSFQEAFDWACAQSAPGDVILLSPGCASFGWFRNFSHRGETFRSLARNWSPPSI